MSDTLPRCRPLAPALALAAVLSCAAPAIAAPTVPPSGALTYDIVRNGDTIGSNTLHFSRSGDGLSVDISTRVLVTVAMVPVYRFEHDGHERWEGGKLVALKSVTDDDGTHRKVALQAGDSGLTGTADGKPGSAPADILPASLWDRDIVDRGQLLNTLTGKPMTVRITHSGTETVTVGGKPVAADRYVVSGELARELWYDKTGRLVHVRMKGDDGSTVDYVLR